MPSPAAIVSLIAAACGLWAGDVNNVLLVVNRNAPESLRLGEFYAHWHQLAPHQVCTLAISPRENTTRALYQTQIAQGVGDCLRKSGGIERTYYIVLTQGIPIRIEGTQKGDWQQTDSASVDSELALLYADLHLRQRDVRGPAPNPFFRQKEQEFSHPAFPIYLVTRLAGYSFEDARRMVERCRGAKNTGQVVLDLKGDRDDMGNDWLRNAAILLPGNRTLVDTTFNVITSAPNVIGYASWGSNDRRRKSRKSGMEWLPGAIAAEFVSTNARTLRMPPFTWTIGDWSQPANFFAGSPQSMILDYVWEGVSGISGYTDEPYLAFTAHPDLLFPAYLAGRNLAESFYLSLPVLSWQSMILGDPLCHLE